MAENEFTLPMDYEPAEDNSINAIQATENPEKFLQEGTAPSIVETSFDKVVDSGTASQDWLVDTFAQATTGTYNTPDLWKNRKPTTVEEMGRSLVHGFIDPVKSTFSGVVKAAAYAEAAMEDAEHGLAELIVGRSFPNRNFGRALIHSMNEKERSEAWERTLYENRQGIKSDAWYNMLASAFGSSATLFGGAVAGVPGKTLSGAEGLMIGASYFSEQSSKLESAGESGAKALPFAVFIGTLGGLIAKTGGETIISDAVQRNFGPAAVSFARGATDNLVKRISKRLLNPVAKRAAKAEAIEELAQEASTIGTEKIQDAVLGTQVNQSTWQEDVQRMLVGLFGGATVGGLVGEYVYNKNLNQLQKKLEPVFDEDKNKAFKAATAIADAVLNEAVAENAAVKSLEGHVADLNPELAQVLSYVFEDLVNQGFVDFRQATPDEVRQAGLDWANLMSAAAILDSMERNIPLRTHPLFNAIAEIDRILLEGRNPSTGDLLPLDINNAAVRELANNIEDFIEQGRETRQAEEASRLAALRESDLKARQKTIQELERAAIAELEKEQAANNQERITELQQKITELQHQMDMLREERDKYAQERAAQGRVSIKQARAQETKKAKEPKKTVSKMVDLPELSDADIDMLPTYNKKGYIKQSTWKKIRSLFTEEQLTQVVPGFYGRPDETLEDIIKNTFDYKTKAARKISMEEIGPVATNFGLSPQQVYNAFQIARGQEVQDQEQAAQIPDDLQYQDTPFDLAAQNARLDDIYPEYKGETIEVNGVERTVYNSNGERIAKSEPALRNFWNWFGDSKVVDSQGRPLVVYHSTDADFNAFDITKAQIANYGRGFYFTAKKGKFDYVVQGKKKEPISAYLSLKNPVFMQDFINLDKIHELLKDNPLWIGDRKKNSLANRFFASNTDFKFINLHDALAAELAKQREGKDYSDDAWYEAKDDINRLFQEMGFDGLVVREDFSEIVAFEPNQIKSTQNTGEFGIGVDDMYHQDQVVKKVGEDRTNADKWLAKQDIAMKIAKDFFGTTENIQEAGYILPDGSMLDFSGANFGGSVRGKRMLDHRDIRDAFEEFIGTKEFPDGVGMEDFINAGAIRFQPENITFMLAHSPTKAQLETIDEILEDNARQVRLFQHDPTFEIMTDANDWGTSSAQEFSKSFDVNVRSETIKRIAAAFYKGEGVLPEMLMHYQNKKTSKSTTGLGTEHRGGYDPVTKAIIFNKTSDLSTLFHESAHYWFDRNLRYYRTGLASPEWKKNWEDVMEALGATPNARGTIPVSVVRSASEKFARSMEAYLREGKYENAAMKWAHQDYANMVKRIYRNIWSTYWGMEELSPAVQKWFDMFGLKTDDATTAFAEEDKIETAESVVGAVIAEDATEPDVDAETKAIVADAGAQVVENPATQEIAVVPADPFETGKKARSKLPRSAEAATGVSMDDIIYNRRSMSDAFKAAQQLVNTDPVRAWEILKGGQEMVDGLYAGDIYRALIAKYQAENNPTMLKNVVQAFAGAARRAGRSVKAFDLESPRISFEKTINSLDKIFDTKKNDKRIEKVKNELKEFLHDPSALRVGWEEFKNIVGCK